MLKKRMTRAGLLTTSFILIAVVSGSKTATNNPGDTTAGVSSYVYATMNRADHIFDSAGLCTCLPDIDLSDAPRIKMHPQLTKYAKDHHKRDGTGMDKIKLNGDRYLILIDTVFTKYNLPLELKYLAVIESKLNTRVYSRVGARGLWQFMPVTARQFGLKVKGKYDERTYAYKSTVAAAKYLTYLYGLFDDWLLTIAAYNSGPGYVYAAIKKSGSRNFWALQKYLPLETRNHVKKFISTHYYFEGRGSLTTLTKSETAAHISAVARYVEKQKALQLELAPDSVTTETVQLISLSNR